MRKLPILIILMLIVIPMVSATWFNNSYSNKMSINCSKIVNGYPFVINGSSGVTLGGEKQLIWTYCMGSSTALYYNNYSSYIVANDTKRLPFEVDVGNMTSTNATSVWSGYFVAVYHMNDRNDSLGLYDWTSGGTSPVKANGLIGNGYLLTGDSFNATGLTGSHLGLNYSFMMLYNASGLTPTNYGGIFYNPVVGDYGCIISGNSSSMRCLMGSGTCDREFTMNWSKSGLVSFVQGRTGDNTNSSVYVNGSIVDGSDITCTTALTAKDYRIGLGDRSGREFNGLIDEWRISNMSLDKTYQNYTYYNYLNTIGFGSEGLTTSIGSIVYYNDNSTTDVIASETAYYSLEINKSSWTDTSAKLVWNGTHITATKSGTGNWTYTASKLFPNSAGKSITYYWLMNATNANLTRTNIATSSNTQDIIELTLGECSGALNTTALSFEVYDEDTNIFLNNTPVSGLITYWVSSKDYETNITINRTTASGFQTGGVCDYKSNTGSSDATNHSVYFTVNKISIISMAGTMTDMVLAGVHVNISINNDTTTLVTKEASTKETFGGSGKYGVRANFTLSNYSSYLYPGITYNLEISSSGAFFTSSTPTSYSGDIISYSSQNTFSTSYGVPLYVDINCSGVNYDGYMWIGATSLSQSINGTSICISPASATVHADATIFYENNLTHRYYLLNATLSNATTSIYLYGVNDSTNYVNGKISLVDASYNPLKNYYAKLLRFYPSDNLWRTVQMYKSDEFGNTYFDVIETSVDYKLVIQDYDTTLKTTNTINFKKPYGADLILEVLINPLTAVYNFYDGYNYTYNPTTKIFRLDWNDVTGTTTSVTLTALSSASNGQVLWCNSTSLGSAGTINCNLSTSSGSVLVTGYRTSSATTFVLFNKYISELSKDLYDAMDSVGLGKDAMFWAFVICCVIIIAGAFYPLSLLVSIPVSLMVVWMLGITNFLTNSMIIGSVIFAIIIGILVKK